MTCPNDSGRPGIKPDAPRELPNPRPPETPTHEPDRFKPDPEPETPDLPLDPMPTDPPVELPSPEMTGL